MWWKKKQDYVPYNFDEEKEFAIYKHVCGKKIKSREKKRIEGYSFGTYDEWKAYVIEKYTHVSLKSLYDVKRFLKRRKKSGNTMLEAYKSLLVPWIIALLTFMLSQNMDLTKIDEYGLIAKVIFITFCCGGMVVFATIVFNYLIKNFATQNLVNLMYYDYAEIIKEMIGKREKEEASEREAPAE